MDLNSLIEEVGEPSPAKPVKLLARYLARDMTRNQGLALADYSLPSPTPLLGKTAVLTSLFASFFTYLHFEAISWAMVVWAVLIGTPFALAITIAILMTELEDLFTRVRDEGRGWL